MKNKIDFAEISDWRQFENLVRAYFELPKVQIESGSGLRFLRLTTRRGRFHLAKKVESFSPNCLQFNIEINCGPFVTQKPGTEEWRGECPIVGQTKFHYLLSAKSGDIS